MSAKTEIKQRTASLHEAGHCVAAWSLRAKVFWARISQDSPGNGKTKFFGTGIILHDVAILFSGVRAVHTYAHRLNIPSAGGYFRFWTHGDGARINFLTAGMPRKQRKRMIYTGQELADIVLNNNESSVIELSRRLYAAGYLAGRMLDDVKGDVKIFDSSNGISFKPVVAQPVRGLR
ncbi:MAG TPA: hypothetical protein VMG59_06895 [Phycisphaerae bacterium]|nr:hypothetical protein [Phycisphaerae bacterium]